MKSVFLLTAAASVLTAHAQTTDIIDPTSKDNSAECNCYTVSGPDPGYFQYHRFWDFRNVSNDGDNDYTNAPEFVTNVEDVQNTTSSFFNTSKFLDDWQITNGVSRLGSPYPTWNSPANLYISRNSTEGAESQTYLTFRTVRLDNGASTSELESNQKVQHSSIRGRFRVIPNTLSETQAPFAGDRAVNNVTTGSNDTHPVANGAVFGFFTYFNDEQESDIEVLTSDPIGDVRYSNQPDYDAQTDESVPGASSQVTLPNDLDWTEWQDHRIDWFEGVSRWYVNDQLVLEKRINVPSTPSELILNLWSDGGNWSNEMAVGAQVTVGVQWIDIAFNTSSSTQAEKSNCVVGCRLDTVQNVGFPQVTFNSTIETVDSGALRSGQVNLLMAPAMTLLLVLSAAFF